MFDPFLLLWPWALLAAFPATVLDASDFGVVGDGVADDGPAIARMLGAAAEAERPVLLRFPEGRAFYVKEGFPGRYLFDWQGVEDVTLDGGGSVFLLDPHLRFLRLLDSENVILRNLKVDFRPLPFVDGVISAVNAEARRLDVKLDPATARPLAGGPTREDGEQAFFSMLWYDGPYGALSRHYWTERIEPGAGEDVVRVYAGPDFSDYGDIEPGWRISIPVPGIAHRYGPGECFDIDGNSNVLFEDIELWSAPWFGFGVSRNEGEVTFRRVRIRPKPGASRLMTLWRDGFHVKGNRGPLLWEDCVITSMNDDAFNISTHSSVVEAVKAGATIEVRQKFPLMHVPWRAGDTLMAADEENKRLLGQARIVSVEEGPAPPPIQGHPAAPRSSLTLDAPIKGLAEGAMVWNASACNPDTTLRRCRIEMSCRMQSPVTIEDCDVTGLLWFYAEHVEGGFPHQVTVRNSVLKLGRGNPAYNVSFSGMPVSGIPRPPRAIHDVTFTGNEVRGGFVVEGCEDARIENNRFMRPDGLVRVRGNAGLVVRDNVDASGEPVAAID